MALVKDEAIILIDEAFRRIGQDRQVLHPHFR